MDDNTAQSASTKQQGFLLIGAVILIVFVSLIAATIAYFSLARSSSFMGFNDQSRALNVAHTGLEKTKLLMSNPPSGVEPLACGAINGHSDLTDTHILGGQFTVTSNDETPISSASGTSISGKLKKTDTTIAVNNGSAFPLSGQLMIEHEKVNYDGKSGNDLLNADRGADGTMAVEHKNDTPIDILTCHIHSQGQYPANNSRSQLTVNLKSSSSDAWLVGDTSGGDPLIAQWNGSSWTEHSSDFASDDELNNISKISYNDLWAMGQDSTAAAIFHWDGDSWTQTSDGPSDDFMVNDIACPRHKTCFSAGDFAGTVQLHRFQSSSWNNASVDSSVPDVDYLSITCPLDPDNSNKEECWSVGPAHDNSGQDQLTMIRNDGNGWALNNEDSTNNPIDGSETLHSVDCGKLNNCTAVGDSGIIVHWDGSSWSKNSTASNITSNTLNAVICLHNGACWAAGNSGTVLHHPSGGSWSQQTSNTSNDLVDIDCSSTQSCWAVGDNTTTIHFYNSSWHDESNSLPSSASLKGVIDLSGSSNHFWNWELS